MLPAINGFDILKSLRKSGIQTPILLLRAKSQVQDRVKGLDLGGDDYLTKPFAQEELEARIRALLRRHGQVQESNALVFHDLTLDYQKLILWSGDKHVALTLKESDLLQFLMTRKHMITPKDMLIEKIWGFNTDAEDNNVEVYISFLRKKTEVPSMSNIY